MAENTIIHGISLAWYKATSTGFKFVYVFYNGQIWHSIVMTTMSSGGVVYAMILIFNYGQTGFINTPSMTILFHRQSIFVIVELNYSRRQGSERSLPVFILNKGGIL